MLNDSEPDGIDCERALAWIAARISQTASAVDDTHARAHLARCGECRDAYRSQMALGMRLARAAESAASATSVGTPAPTIGASLRKRRGVLVVVACSLVLFALSRIGHGLRADPTLPVHWEHGAAWVAGEPLGESFGPRTGLRGDLVETGVDGRLRLQFDTGTLHVEESTTLLVESAVAERVRLVGGAVRVEGDARLWTPFGIVVVAAGGANVTLVGERLALRSLAGDVRVLTAAGEHVIAAGSGAELEAGRWTDSLAAH